MPFSHPYARAFAVLSLWVLCACAGGGRKSQAGDPAAGNYAGKTLAVILPDSSSASVRDPRELDDALREAFPGGPAGGSSALLAHAFDDIVWSGLSSSLDYVTPVRVPDSVPPAPEGRRVGLSIPAAFGTPAQAYAAPDSAWLAGHGAAADLVLAIGPIVAKAEQEQIDAYKFGGSIRITRLIVQGNYLIWDYAAKRAVAKGIFRSKVEYRGSPKGKDWVKAFDDALEVVGGASPFRGPKWYHRAGA